VANWVQDTILQEEFSMDRAAQIKHFISIADVCVFMFVKIEFWLMSRRTAEGSKITRAWL
jgi:hypothetical protein